MPGGAHLTRVLLSFCVVLCAACAPSAVPVAVPSPAPEIVALCERLMAAMPSRVLNASSRETAPDSPLTAAWGDPPIEVTCGVAPPARSNSDCLEVNGVGWYGSPVENGVVFTTIGRKVYVEAAVPNRYSPEPNALTDLAAAITTHNPVVTPCR